MTRHILGSDVYSAWAVGTLDYGSNRSGGNVFFEGRTLYSYGKHFPLGIRLPWGFLLNGDRYSATTNGHQAATRGAAHQAAHRQGKPVLIIPFSALHTLRIDPHQVVPLDIEPDREIITPCRHRNPEHPEQHVDHLLGRSVLQVGDAYYLSGLDETARIPTDGYFLAQLPGPRNTVAGALELLKPLVVLQAEAAGLPVKRQGEWFFVLTTFPILNRADVSSCALLQHRDLRRTPRHRVTHLLRDTNGQQYARGTVRHAQHEHRMLSLGNQWHSVHENTEIRSARSSGRVD